MKKSFLSLILIFTLTTFSLSADEGMWMLHLLKQQKYPEMKKLGLKLRDYDIYNPNGTSIKDAVVQFGGGCTGEVISSQGLVLTMKSMETVGSSIWMRSSASGDSASAIVSPIWTSG